jgi:Arc/MetJ-type ribon-helix-helix transcriptional regulator
VKTLTIRLPEPLVAQIAAESRERQVSKSDVVRERLQNGAARRPRRTQAFDNIAQLIGAVDGLPADLSARRKHHLKMMAYGRKRPR